MKRVSIIAVALGCLFALALVGCGGAQKSVDADSLKGTWKLGESSKVGFSAALNLADEDFAEMMIADSYMYGTWKTDGSTATLEIEDSGTAEIYVSDGKLIMGSEDGSRLVFEKSSGNEFGYDEDDGLEELSDAELADLETGDTAPPDVQIDDIKAVPVADDKYCKIEVTGKGQFNDGDPTYRLAFTNKSDKDLYLYVAENEFEVDGKKIDGNLGDMVSPGQTVDAHLYFLTDELGGGVEKLKNVKGKIHLVDVETDDTLATYDLVMK